MPAKTIESVKALRPLPSQTSSIDHGEYTVTAERQQDLVPPDEHTQTKVWFQTPALTLDTINHIDVIQLWAESHDQGALRNSYLGNWTWFELAILEDEKSTTPKVMNGVELVWKSHRNRFQTSDYAWEAGRRFTEHEDLVHLLEDGNVIAVRICAKFAHSKVAVRGGYLAITIGDAEIEHKPVQYAKLVSEIQVIQDVLHETNVQTRAAFTPQIPRKAIAQADAFSTADKTPLRVLSLDGGGVRGMASLLMLQAVMAKVHPNKKPWEVFDLIGGTSTGGLIAIMLGRLRMSIGDCIKRYKDFMTEIFGSGYGKIGQAASLVFNGSKYGSNDLEKVIKGIVRQELGDENAPLLDDRKDACKVFVMAVNSDAANNRGPVFLRSYINSQNPSEVPGIKIWEAARATSAAPVYFPPMKVGQYTFVDGGLQANNPLGWLWTEVLSLFGPARTTDCFLSIGTGIPANTPLNQKAGLFNVVAVASTVPSIATNTQVMHILFRCLINAFAPKPQGKKYWRLNIGEEIPEWKERTHPFYDIFCRFEKEILHTQDYKKLGDLDDLEAMPELLRMTTKYIDLQQEDLSDCAAALMNGLDNPLFLRCTSGQWFDVLKATQQTRLLAQALPSSILGPDNKTVGNSPLFGRRLTILGA
ncbi:hypothetical protein OPT61_g7729 [Boeremia exigua]|uniref:Uncharacterized protein n=1 Tax=Boeremia exigua TaxID=749465 RepID=A0ACC2I273_9PLEO|nr:hypothetical protein OPT61_g7729 [Boeremia exigua]